jgi:hypothetical protein
VIKERERYQLSRCRGNATRAPRLLNLCSPNGSLLTLGWQQGPLTTVSRRIIRKERIVPMKGSCHCGHTQFEVSEAPAGVTRCTCSLCSKRGALWAYYTPAQFRLTSPAEYVATYLCGSRTVKHHFCAHCGCGTYSESRDWSSGKPDFKNPKVGVNARLFDHLDLDAVPVTVIDGKNLW